MSTKERVDKAIRELSYRPDHSARNLASHRSHLIGLIYDDPAAYELPSSGYIIKLQQGVLQACRAAFCELLIHPCDYRKKNVAKELKTLIDEARPAGIVLAAPLSNMPKIVRAIEATSTPFVRISPGSKKANQLSVVTNDRESSAEMVRYLADLGHKRIAFIKGNSDHKAVAKRFAGYQDGLEQSELRYSKQLVADGDNSFGSGEICAEKLLKLKRPPTAIFAANDDMAAGVIRVAHRLGIDVPGRLSVAGFDDIVLSRQLDPTLTTIRQPLVRMAELAASMLIKSNGKQKKTSHSIRAEIQIRESTGPAPTS